MAEAGAQPDEALPGELVSLIEPLAVEIHLAWTRTKLIQGWRPGALDRDAMTHPDLIPYSQLPEASKVLDRATAAAALSGLDRLGYRVIHKPGTSVHS
jgi:adenylate cyclase